MILSPLLLCWCPISIFGWTIGYKCIKISDIGLVESDINVDMVYLVLEPKLKIPVDWIRIHVYQVMGATLV